MSGGRATVLVVGSGGREHALAWKLSLSPQVGRVIVAPGNDGFPSSWERWHANLAEGRPEFERLVKRARQEGVTLAVIGPDNPLADGIVDVFEGFGLPTFGPDRAAAQLEWSKSFAKEVMRAARVPTAEFTVIRSPEECLQALRAEPWARGGAVVKADGLAFGKGVRVCFSEDETMQAARELLPLSGRCVLEQRLQGEELSWMAFCDGSRVALLEPARDYKRLKDGGEGPNTGGMGAFSPVPGATPELGERIREQVFLPVLAEMRKRGAPFRGLLYAGLMVDLRSSPPRFWVIEFNSRFGDPEAQVLLPRIDGDLFDWCQAVARADLGDRPGTVPFVREAAVVVIGAAAGYPDAPEKGRAISGLEPGRELGPSPDYFVAGAAAKNGRLVTSGGRVFGALGMGVDLGAARRQAYDRLTGVRFEGMQYRTDIARAEMGASE